MDALTNNLTTDTQGTGLRGMGITLFGAPMIALMREEWYILLLVLLLVIGDFRLARRECAVRRAAADANGEKLKEKFRWRFSRAWRRTLNKYVDYLVLCTVGLSLGAALLSPLWGVERYWGAVGAGIIITIIEGKSMLSHFLYLHASGVDADKAEGKLLAFVRTFAVFFAKKKNEEVGEALEEALNAAERKTN